MADPLRYRAPEADLSPGSADRSDPEVDLLREFVAGPDGRGAREAYLIRWQRRLRGESTLCGFHWPAFFIGSVWFFYRRMYGVAFGILALQTGGRLLSDAVEDLSIAATLAGSLTVTALYVGIGLAANPLYLLRAQRVLRTHAETPEVQRLAVTDAGGVSWGGCVLGILLWGACATVPLPWP